MKSKQTTFMFESVSKKETFIIFTKNEKTKKLVSIYGPLFKEEIEPYILDNFNEDKSFEVLSEELFATIYSSEYRVERSIFWVEYLASRLEATNLLEVFSINYDEDGIESNIFSAFIEDGCLVLNFSLSMDPALSAIISLDIFSYLGDIFEIKIKPSFYISSIDNSIHIEENAFYRKLAEQSISPISIN